MLLWIFFFHFRFYFIELNANLFQFKWYMKLMSVEFVHSLRIFFFIFPSKDVTYVRRCVAWIIITCGWIDYESIYSRNRIFQIESIFTFIIRYYWNSHILWNLYILPFHHSPVHPFISTQNVVEWKMDDHRRNLWTLNDFKTSNDYCYHNCCGISCDVYL